MYCEQCGTEITENREVCPNCGTTLKNTKSKSTTTAIVLSIVWTGLGQLYNGQIVKGVALWIVCLIGLMISPILGIIVWACGIWDAYNVAKETQIGITNEMKNTSSGITFVKGFLYSVIILFGLMCIGALVYGMGEGISEDGTTSSASKPNIENTESDNGYKIAYDFKSDYDVAVYDIAKFEDSYIRESDGFELSYKVFDDASYWSVMTLTDYPAYNNMLDDEPHGLYINVKHRYSIRESHDKMVEITDNSFNQAKGNDTVTNLTYGDLSHKIKQYPYVAETSSRNANCIYIIIQKDRTIGELRIYGYSNMGECEEVANYYAPFLESMLNDIAQYDKEKMT